MLRLSAGINCNNNHLVLNTDDDKDLLKVFKLTFKSKYDVILIASGEECVDRYIKEKNGGNKIDLILLDHGLRGNMLGDLVARKIKEFQSVLGSHADLLSLMSIIFLNG